MREEKQEQKTVLTAPQSFAVGGIAGALDAAINHPLWTTKMRMQMQAPLSLNPQILYQGISIRIASKVPITAIQVGVDTLIYPQLSSYDRLSSDTKRYISSFSAGACSALVYGPLEMTITQMNQKKSSLTKTLTILAETRGIFSIYTGSFLTAIREGTFALSFLAAYPTFKAAFAKKLGDDHPEKASALLAGVSAGSLTALATHPLDTTRAAMQQAKTPKSIIQTTKDLYHSQSALGFFNGAVPRVGLVSASVVFISEMRPQIEATFK